MTIVQTRWFKVSQSSTASFLGVSCYCAMAATRARIRSAGELCSLAVSSTLVVWVPRCWVSLYELIEYARINVWCKERMSTSRVCAGEKQDDDNKRVNLDAFLASVHRFEALSL